MVFDELLSHSGIAVHFRNTFTDLVVDEFQDSSNLQERLLQKLVDPAQPRLTAVGDEDQCILRESYTNLKQRNLLSNYRSSANILRAGICLLDFLFEARGQKPRGNPGGMVYTFALLVHEGICFVRFRTLARVFSQDGMPVEVWKVTTPLQQAKAIADRMERRHTDGVAWSEMACLFRCLKRGDRGKLYTILEDELMRRAVPYVIVGGKTLLERASVLDLMSYIRLAVGHDDQAFRRVLYRPKRRLSQKVLAAIERQQHIMEQDRTEWGHVGLDEAARVMVKTGVGIKQAQREHLRGLLAILDKIRDRCVIEQLPEMLSFVWTESGLGKMHGAKVQQSDSGSEEAEAEEADSDEEGDEENGLNAAQIPQSRLSVPPEIARLLDIAMVHANAFKMREAHLQRSNDDGTRVPKLFEMTRTYVLENEMMTSRLRKHLPKCILDELYVDQGRGRRIVQSFISEITLQETSEPDI